MDIVKDIISPFYINPFPYKVSPVHEKTRTPMKFPMREQGEGQEKISTAGCKLGFQPAFNNLNPSSCYGKGDGRELQKFLE